MQEYNCPKCGHISTYDPWVESASCPECGHTPDQGIAIRGRLSKTRTDAHQAFLDELLAHWNGTFTPDLTFNLLTPDLALLFFEDYQRAMGEDPRLSAGRSMRYVRNYHPDRAEILEFVGAFLLLRRGLGKKATQKLVDMTFGSPQFADTWIWRSATTDDPAERRECLENALLHEPAHPLARDAMAVLRGVVDQALAQPKPALTRLIAIRCYQCGGDLRYRAGADDVVCPHCGTRIPLEREDILEDETPLVGDLRLQRRYKGYLWQEAQRVLHCASCAATLTMTEHLARRCVFCGSTNVLIEDSQIELEQPDGFLPFQVEETVAATAVQTALQSGLRRLRTWWTGETGQPGEIQGIYLPFWIFDGIVEARTWQSTLSITRPEGGIAPLSDQRMFDNMPFPAVYTPTPKLIAKILPYEAKEMVRYNPRLLADWPAALYQRDVELVVEDAYDAMLNLARASMPRLVPLEQEQSAYKPVAYRRSFQVTSTTYQLVLLPLWVQIVHEGEKRRLAIVNGQTGKIALGQLHAEEEGE
jgi:predicted RNA-binding Zn-ribbon protein involved in translation (DUF1610 family)